MKEFTEQSNRVSDLQDSEFFGELHRNIPDPPEPYIAHTYTLLSKDFLGRQKEINFLTDWVAKSDSETYKNPILCLVAPGGMGKSALAWKWFNDITCQRINSLAGQLWWSFYENSSYEEFIVCSLAYVSRASDEKILKELENVNGDKEKNNRLIVKCADKLLDHLKKKPFLFVLDGLERMLNTYALQDIARVADEDLDEHIEEVTAGRDQTLIKQTEEIIKRAHGQTTDPRMGRFLRNLVVLGQSRILVSTRLFPEEWKSVKGEAIVGCCHYRLEGLHEDDALELFRTYNVKGSRDVVQPFLASFNNHPLLIKLLAGVIKNYRRAPGDFEQWRQDNPALNLLDLVEKNTSPIHVTALRELCQQRTVSYSVILNVSSKTVLVGGAFEVEIGLNQPEISNENSCSIEISGSEVIDNELNLILSAPNFRFESDDIASLPLDLIINNKTFTPTSPQTLRTVCFRLTALRPGISTITAEIYRGDTFETTLETTIQVIGLEESTFLDSNIKVEPRPVSQPDLVLQVQTLWNETAATCIFCYQLRNFRAASHLSSGITYQSPPLSDSWLEQVNDLLQTALGIVSDSLPTDGRSHLTSLGQYLFQHLFPTDLQTALRHLNRHQPLTLMILADQNAQFPWTLLHNGQEFLGEHFIIGHWLSDLNSTYPYEFPIVCTKAYTAHNGEDLSFIKASQGLYLRYLSQSVTEEERQDTLVPLDVVMEEQEVDHKVRPVKIKLRRNCPLVQ